MKRALMFLGIIFIAIGAYAAVVTSPLPAGCVPALTQDSNGNFSLTCGGTPPPPPPPPPPGPISCSGFNATHVVDFAFAGQSVIDTTDLGGSDALIARFKVPANVVGTATINVVEFGGGPVPRFGSLSASPCDFTSGITGQLPFVTVFSGDIAVSESFHVGTVPLNRRGKPSGLLLVPDTYYLNMGTSNCPAVVCNVRVTFSVSQ